MELSKNTSINKHGIKLVEGKQPLYRLTYSLRTVELETLKTYIKTQLKTGFIQSFISPASALIFFNPKLDGSLRLYINYKGLNNLTIKNLYLLPLIGEVFNRLSWAKRFTQLDLTSAYHKMRIWENDKWKTIFCVRYGYFKYQVLPFWLFYAPISFQGYINKILAEKLNIFVLVSFNNILIYTEKTSQLYVAVVY